MSCMCVNNLAAMMAQLKNLPLCHRSFRVVVVCRSGKLNDLGFASSLVQRGDLRGEFVTGVGRGIRIAVQAAQIASPRRVDLKDPCGSGQVHVSALAPSPR